MLPSPQAQSLDNVRQRYGTGAKAQVPELCCPVDYDASLLKVLPDEILERDYGCGDPSQFVRSGDVVLDLGAGGGKICYMASQIVGPEGRVIGVDATPEMLDLSRRWLQEVGDRIGWHNVEFRHGHIQDLALDRDSLGAYLAEHPVSDIQSLGDLKNETARLRKETPMVADESVDIVISNCVLNLVKNADKQTMFREIHRVLKRGGRCAISDIVCDEDVPAELQADPELWSGCISGSMREDRFLKAFEEAGLYGIEVVSYEAEPWAVVQGLEFRSMTVVAHKGKEGPCYDHGEAVIYNGPWKVVVDDDGHTLVRGERTAVCRKTFSIYGREPYADDLTPVSPLKEVAESEAPLFDCSSDGLRDPSETKVGVKRADKAPGVDSCGEPEGGCC